MKRIIVTITLATAAAWLLAIPAAAQSHGQGHGGAAAGSMGGMHDTEGGSNGNGGSNANAGSKTSGPRNPGELLTQNTKLSSKLSSLLPAGTDLQQAASGYRNLGQFVAAVHVSHNLGIPFDSLKCRELAQAQYCLKGMTVPSKTSNLGQSIQTLKPAMTSTESKSAAKQAEKEASGDVRETAS